MWLFGTETQPRQRFKRKDDRFKTEAISTPLGRVKDLSASGLCISGAGRTRLVRGQALNLQLKAPRVELSVQGRVAWVRKHKGGFEAGIALIGVSDRMAGMLQHLARFGFLPGPEGHKVVCASENEKPSTGRRRDAHDQHASETMDPREILGVDRFASEQEIRSAYRTLVRRYHPDRDRSGDAAKRFAQIVAAYELLKRQGYQRKQRK